MKRINVALVGHKFMGRAHTHAITDAPIFFDLGVEIGKKVICSNEESVMEIGRRWGWEKAVLDWREIIEDKEIDAVSIAAPQQVSCRDRDCGSGCGQAYFL